MENLNDWIDVTAALELMQVKRESLYAYVSRGYVRSRPKGDGSRASLYAAADIDAMAARRRRSRKRADIAQSTMKWGEPILETRISTVRGGRLIFGARDACDMADTCTLEETAHHHWRSRHHPDSTVQPDIIYISEASTAKARAFDYLAHLAPQSPHGLGRMREPLAREAAAILSGFADNLIGTAYDGAIHRRFGHAWNLNAQETDIIRRALVLISDHELNASTFAVRIAASAGTSLSAAALAGLSTLSGPLHGDASQQAVDYLSSALKVDRNVQTLNSGDNSYSSIPGMGHTLYPKGDIRAKVLIAAINPDDTIEKLVEQFEVISGSPPNIDMAHAVLSVQLDLPRDAAFTLFAMGRLAGWLAHAIEQIESAHLIRPRAIFKDPAHETDLTSQ